MKDDGYVSEDIRLKSDKRGTRQSPSRLRLHPAGFNDSGSVHKPPLPNGSVQKKVMFKLEADKKRPITADQLRSLSKSERGREKQMTINQLEYNNSNEGSTSARENSN